MSERGAISPERDEIVGERGAELSGAVCCDFERWSGEREFSPLSSAHMLCSDPGSDVTTQCLGSFLVLLRSWFRRNPAVGLFIVGILRRLLERAVLSAIELMHFFGKYRFVYILFY